VLIAGQVPAAGETWDPCPLTRAVPGHRKVRRHNLPRTSTIPRARQPAGALLLQVRDGRKQERRPRGCMGDNSEVLSGRWRAEAGSVQLIGLG
jgi:hypothetical protein